MRRRAQIDDKDERRAARSLMRRGNRGNEAVAPEFEEVNIAARGRRHDCRRSQKGTVRMWRHKRHQSRRSDRRQSREG
jgi:hypothetical protein